MSIPEAFWTYLDEGSTGSLEVLHGQIKADPFFTDRAPWYPRASHLLQNGRFDEVIDLIEGLMPGVFFCPEAHSMLGYAYEHIGEHDRSAAQYAWAGAALEAIRASGRGSQTSPWRVLRVIDEYAQLRELGIAPVGQRIVEIGGRRFDVLTDTRDAEYWFELV